MTKRVLICLIASLLLAGCAPKAETPPVTNTTANTEVATTQPTADPTAEPAADPTAEPTAEPVPAQNTDTSSGTLGDYTVSILDAEAAEDYEGNPAVTVTFEWTNNADKATMFTVATSVKCFQDGIECDRATISGSSRDAYKEIKTGATQKVTQSFQIDQTKPFDIEVTELFSFTDDAVVSKSFDALK